MFHLVTVERGIMVKAPKSLGNFAYLLQCDAVLKKSISLSCFLIVSFASGHVPVREVWFMDFPQY